MFILLNEKMKSAYQSSTACMKDNDEIEDKTRSAVDISGCCVFYL